MCETLRTYFHPFIHVPFDDYKKSFSMFIYLLELEYLPMELLFQK